MCEDLVVAVVVRMAVVCFGAQRATQGGGR